MVNQNKATKVWNSYYKSMEDGPVGNLYPSEPLIRVVSTIRKGINVDDKLYFGDEGKENTNRTNFFGKASELRIFTEETDFSPVFNSWWHIYGKK